VELEDNMMKLEDKKLDELDRFNMECEIDRGDAVKNGNWINYGDLKKWAKSKIGKFEREIKEIESQKLPRECASRRIIGMFHRKVPNIKLRLDNGEMKEIEILKAKIQFIKEEILGGE